MIVHLPIVTVHAVHAVHAPQSRLMQIPGTIVVFKTCEVALAGSECSQSGQATLAEHLVTWAGTIFFEKSFFQCIFCVAKPCLAVGRFFHVRQGGDATGQLHATGDPSEALL